MRTLLQFPDADKILRPYYETLKNGLKNSFEDVIKAKEFFSENGLFVNMKPRTKGSLINDCLRTRMTEAFYGNKDVLAVESGGVFGLLFHEQIFIRFNKMDSGFGMAVQKTKQYLDFYNQSEDLENIPERAMLVWGCYIPDSTWGKLMSNFLCCFNGSLNWYFDLNDNSVQQLSLDIDTPIIPNKPRRATPKKKDTDRQIGEERTGTED